MHQAVGQGVAIDVGPRVFRPVAERLFTETLVDSST